MADFKLNSHLKSDRVPTFIIFLFLLIICFCVYFNALNNNFLYDDQFFIVQNTYIRDFRFIPQLFKTDVFHFAPQHSSYYRPLQTLSYACDYFFWKLNPAGYRLTNIVIHSLNSFFVFLLLYLIFKDKSLALLTSILFCIHPIQIGVVTLIGGRSNILEVMFTLLSLITFINYFLYKRRMRYLSSIFLFVLALLSREGALLLPAFIVASSVALNINKRRLFIGLIPFIIISGIYLILRSKFIPCDKLNLNNIFHLRKISTFFYLYQDYLRQLILPYGFIGMFTKNITFKVTLFFLIFISLFVIRLFISRNKIIIFGFAFYILGLLPILKLTDTIPFFGTILSEPYVYIASIGFFVIISYLLLNLHFHFPKTALVCIISIISFYISLAVINNIINYKDQLSFSNYILSIDKENTIAHINLGNIYYEEKMLDLAKKEAELVLSLEPDAWDAYLLLGNILMDEGNLDKAMDLYKKALILYPSSSEALNNIALIYKVQGKEKEAYYTFKKALQIDPESLPILKNFTGFLMEKRLYQEAIFISERILKLNPDDVDVRVRRGIILAELGYLKEAEALFKEALKLSPISVDAMGNLGTLYANMGDLDKAISFWTKALDIDPSRQDLKNNLKEAIKVKSSSRDE